MDLRLYSRVLWRFRWLVSAGLVLGAVLAVLSYGRISLAHGRPHLTPRSSVIWQSSGVLGVTQHGFPDGLLVPTSDPNRLAFLATLYSEYVSSDAVRVLVREAAGPAAHGQVQAGPERGPGGDILPFLRVTGIDTSANGARRIAQIGIDSLRKYIEQQQQASGTPKTDRVVLKQLQIPGFATVLAGRSKVRPLAVFLTILLATIGMAFILENLRPRIRVVGRESEHPANISSQRSA